MFDRIQQIIIILIWAGVASTTIRANMEKQDWDMLQPASLSCCVAYFATFLGVPLLSMTMVTEKMTDRVDDAGWVEVWVAAMLCALGSGAEPRALNAEL